MSEKEIPQKSCKSMAIPKKFKNLVTHFKLRSSQHSPQKIIKWNICIEQKLKKKKRNVFFCSEVISENLIPQKSCKSMTIA